ncbi:hypothetical protein G7046_g6952 [Stylonectria norvegica]|nr:hypothetical protein G7046_g6952 [Stylonectria norvegica]
MADATVDLKADNARLLYIPIAVFGVICPALVGTRLWSRLRKHGKLGPDDHTIFLALMFALASSALEITSCHFGFGKHFKTILPHDKVEALRFFYLTQISYKISINLTKISILLLYLRIFSKVRWFKWLCWFLIASVLCYAIASVTATIFQCSPVQRAFNNTIDGTCINNATFWFANAGFSITTDIIILFMPMALVYQLQIPQIQKVALLVVFALGGFVVITSCLRVTTIDIAAKSNDATYDISSTMWTVIEMNVAIVCACLPMIRPLIVKIFPRLMPKSSSNNQKYGSSAYGTKSFGANHSQARDKNEWMQIDGKDGIRLTQMKKPGSTGSEESILGPAVEAGPSLVPQPNWPPGSDQQNSIQKTVQYSIEYSKK